MANDHEAVKKEKKKGKQGLRPDAVGSGKSDPFVGANPTSGIGGRKEK